MKPYDAKSPLPGANYEGWGYTQINQEGVPHTGVDYNINRGSPADDYRAPVLCPWAGRVVAAIPRLLYSWGRLVVVRCELPYPVTSSGVTYPAGTVVYIRFAHLAAFTAYRGQDIEAGAQIGTCGGSNGTMPGTWRGDASDPNGQWSPHLHLDIRIGGAAGLPLWDAGDADAVQDWPSVRRYGYPAPGDKRMRGVVRARYMDPHAAFPAGRMPNSYRAAP